MEIFSPSTFESTFSTLVMSSSFAWYTDIAILSSTAFSNTTSTMPAGWISFPALSLKVMSMTAMT